MRRHHAESYTKKNDLQRQGGELWCEKCVEIVTASSRALVRGFLLLQCKPKPDISHMTLTNHHFGCCFTLTCSRVRERENRTASGPCHISCVAISLTLQGRSAVMLPSRLTHNLWDSLLKTHALTIELPPRQSLPSSLHGAANFQKFRILAAATAYRPCRVGLKTVSPKVKPDGFCLRAYRSCSC